MSRRNREQCGVQDLQGVDDEQGGLAGRRRLDQDAGRAQQVAGLDPVQQLVDDPRVAAGAGDDRVVDVLFDGVEVDGDDQVEGGGVARAGGGYRVDPAVKGAVLGVHQLASARVSVVRGERGRGRCWASTRSSRLRWRCASVSGRAFAPWRCQSGEAGGSG
ncbi:hypothetical protein ATE80_25405 [Streptomyces kanasensis]|uniref:Uncharacterized protein n=1 Tax=Streptomyces kanasensis TaxID=936756 RepID=A0A117IUT1_9ACTN|nr:hypothetical protein ATE80_25405 [Streptomyces kanasensis]